MFKNKKTTLILVAIVIIIVAVVGGIWMLTGNKDKDAASTSDTPGCCKSFGTRRNEIP